MTHKAENTYYYSNPHTGILVRNHEVIDGNDIYCDENGVLIKIQYNPVYYSQKDSRWSRRLYGFREFGSSGCAPTSMAMAFSSILRKTILPTDVGDYLYNYTNEFNKRSGGTGGMGIIYASQHFGVKYTPINSKEEMQQSLDDGKIVFAAMGNGKFGTIHWNHAIIISHYKDGEGYALDPLNRNNNGWVSIDLLFREQSKDKDDSRGGSNFYALEE